MGKTICSSHETTERIYSKFDIWVYIECQTLVVASTSSTKHILREDAEREHEHSSQEHYIAQKLAQHKTHKTNRSTLY